MRPAGVFHGLNAAASAVPAVILVATAAALPPVMGVGFTEAGAPRTTERLRANGRFDVLVQVYPFGETPEAYPARLLSSYDDTESVSLVPAIRRRGFLAYRLPKPMPLSDTGAVPGDGLLSARAGDTVTLEVGGRTARAVVEGIDSSERTTDRSNGNAE